ncbi:hypothetical protein ABFS83_07G045700 [Erythranthe nasuta]
MTSAKFPSLILLLAIVVLIATPCLATRNMNRADSSVASLFIKPPPMGIDGGNRAAMEPKHVVAGEPIIDKAISPANSA